MTKDKQNTGYRINEEWYGNEHAINAKWAYNRKHPEARLNSCRDAREFIDMAARAKYLLETTTKG